MYHAKSKCRINGITLGEVSLNLLGPEPSITAKYALCSVETAERFGAGTRNSSWSAETWSKMADFIESMEKDIACDMWDAESESKEESISDEIRPSEPDDVPGL